MAKPALIQAAAAQAADHGASATAKRPKLLALLVTCDDALWPQVGAHFGPDLVGKQVDSIDELLAATAPGQTGIVLWDARGETNAAAALTRVQLHSPRFAVVALDEPGAASAWIVPMQQHLVVATVALPLLADELIAAIANAREEACARLALLGDAVAAATTATAAIPPPPAPGRDPPWIAAGVCGAVFIAGAAFWWLRPGDAPGTSTRAPAPTPAAAPTPVAGMNSAPAPLRADAAPGVDDKVDGLVEQAHRAMLDRHYLEPVDGSALSLYREALLLNPASGEARQGIQRVAEILLARVQSALDERKFDVALQSLETARSINPHDSRLAAFDERIAAVRAEFGPAQIQAALTAQNFDRATQLIDEAARTKSMSSAKLAQLRDEVRRRREEFDLKRLTTLIDTRLQQDRLIDPPRDSAAFYLDEARSAGAGAAALQPLQQEFSKRGAQALHGAIDQRRFAEADRWLAELRANGLPSATVSSLQHDLTAARSQTTHDKPEQPPYLDLARTRLAQGSVLDPENDSALFYVKQLRALDPHNNGLGQVTLAVQAKILERAGAALDAAQLAQAETLWQSASDLGPSADVSAFSERLSQAKLAPVTGPAVPNVVESSLTRANQLKLDYPHKALLQNQEGWVEVAYTVTPNGSVTQIKVVNSSPHGVFEAAATQAVSHLRYQPVQKDGKAVAVNTGIRVVFHVAPT